MFAFADYLRGLCVDLSASLRPWMIEVTAVEADFPAKMAAALGLITNELVTNACKHARRNGSPGRVLVTLARLAGGSLRLSVTDDGGAPAEAIDATTESARGLQLIRSLVCTLGARLEVECGAQGACFSVFL